MKKLSNCLLLALILLATACKKDNPPRSYIKAAINATPWESTSVTVHMAASPSGTEPAWITGTKGDQQIILSLPNTNPGHHPFRINPVTLISFTVEHFQSLHFLKWSIGVETGVKEYHVEYSADGLNWLSGVTLQAGGPGPYQATQPVRVGPDAQTFYRLKIVDLDGSFSYSQILVIRNASRAFYKVDSGLPYRGYDGDLEITSHDPSERIIAGKFHFKVTHTNGTVYELTAGEFSVNY